MSQANDDYTLTVEEAATLRQSFKYCPHCSAEMVDKHVFGKTRRVCPNKDCRFIQFIDPKLTVAVMVLRDNKVLMLKRVMEPGRGSWCFPGGFMEIGETPEEAAIRECKEESGFDVEITDLIDVFYYEDYRGSGVVIMYEGLVVGGQPSLNPNEADELGFFGPDELPSPIAFDSNIQTLAAWRNDEI